MDKVKKEIFVLPEAIQKHYNRFLTALPVPKRFNKDSFLKEKPVLPISRYPDKWKEQSTHHCRSKNRICFQDENKQLILRNYYTHIDQLGWWHEAHEDQGVNFCPFCGYTESQTSLIKCDKCHKEFKAEELNCYIVDVMPEVHCKLCDECYGIKDRTILKLKTNE